MMKTILVFVLGLALCGHSMSQVASNGAMPPMLTMYQGQSYVIEAPNSERVAVGQSELLGSTLLKSGEIVLNAVAPGATNVLIWFNDGRMEQISVVIVESDGWREINEVKELLAGINGLNIRAVGRRVVVEGTVAARDLERIDVVKERYPNMLVLAQPLSDFSQQMVHFDVQVTELNKSMEERLGINWTAGGINGPALRYTKTWNSNDVFRGTDPDGLDPLSGVFTSIQDKSLSYFGIFTEITSVMDFLESEGAALTLASPKLSARSGGTAELMVGGQVPVVSSSINGTTVEYKDFGILLTISPELDPYGNIIANIATEISQLDNATKVQEFPGFRTRKTSNDVVLRKDETLVLSGLINRSDQYTYDKVKWLADIPVLGKLFQSKEYLNGNSELVVFVTPRIMEDLTAGINKEELDRAQEMVERFKEESANGLLD